MKRQSIVKLGALCSSAAPKLFCTFGKTNKVGNGEWCLLKLQFTDYFTFIGVELSVKAIF